MWCVDQCGPVWTRVRGQSVPKRRAPYISTLEEGQMWDYKEQLTRMRRTCKDEDEEDKLED